MAVLCTYFARGACNRGDLCTFSHDRSLNPQHSFGVLHLNTAATTQQTHLKKSPQICSFFLKGTCGRGEGCRFQHPQQQESAHVHTTTNTLPIPQSGEPATDSLSDSRAQIQCRFLSFPGGCQKPECLYSHAADATISLPTESKDVEQEEDDVR